MEANPNEIKVTAYALGELDEHERAEVEAMLTADPALRKQVDEIRATADQLTQGLQHELADPRLTPAAAKRLGHFSAHEPAAKNRPNRFRLPRLAAAACMLVAASLAIALAVQWNAGASRRAARQMQNSPYDPLAMKNNAGKDEWLEHAQQQQPGAAGSISADEHRPGRRSGDEADMTAGEVRGITGTLMEWGPGMRKTDGATLGDEASHERRAEDVAGPLQRPNELAAAARVGRDRGRANEAPMMDYDVRSDSEPVRSSDRAEREQAQPQVMAQEGPARLKLLQQQQLHVEQQRRIAGLQVEGIETNFRSDIGRRHNVDELLEAAREPAHHNTESYDHITDNAFLSVAQNPLSTFSIDVDTASYANVRRFIMQQRQLPPAGAVRIEEMVNYFTYDYSAPAGEHPVTVHLEVGPAPWNADHRLVKVGLKAQEIDHDQRGAANLVFLIDVSGSMNSPDKLPLLVQGMKLMTSELRDDDRVAIVVYAGNSGLVLDSTAASDRQIILDALDKLSAGGSTHGSAGIKLAYEIAQQHFVEGGINRVILGTDGDFNVGVTSRDELTRLIEEKRQTGIFLSILGFGRGNLKDATMEELSNKGNGNYAYIDTLNESRRVLIEQMGATLITVAKDVKLQLEFNPATVASYRLIGYENRMLAKEDFNDDTKDAGEVGSGHTVTALYEIVPAGMEVLVAPAAQAAPEVDELKYQARPQILEGPASDELVTVKLRYKRPDGDESTKLEYAIADTGRTLAQSSSDFQFAAAVAGFGMILRDSPHKGAATLPMVLDLATGSLANDPGNYRAEFVQIVEQTSTLMPRE